MSVRKRIVCPHCRSKRPYYERWCQKCGKKIPNDAKETK